MNLIRFFVLLLAFLWVGIANAADVMESLPILEDSTGTGVVADACSDGAIGTNKDGILAFVFKDSSGNTKLATVQSNGSQVAVDVGINVLGVQIDPRKNILQTATQPTAGSDASTNYATADVYGRIGVLSERSL